MKHGIDKVKSLLSAIYGEKKGLQAFDRILPRVLSFPTQKKTRNGYFSEQDVMLITYGDSLQRPGETPLKTLHGFLKTHLNGVVSHVHFLPFFPYSSDDGFSVMDFFSIDPRLGDWEDVAAVGQDFALMFDYVVNHFSSRSVWFDNYLAGQKGYQDFAIEVDPDTDLSMVTRPRSLPLLSAYEKKNGERVHLWTTFSKDQIDFNFQSLDVLEKMVAVLLFYAAKGASVLRLDAIAYLWKTIGTPSIHLPQTHAMVKLFRAILDLTAPDVILLTETNVPHAENISYFGEGGDEAQMVYNFTLPPLLLHAFSTGDVSLLSAWAQTLHLDSADTTFFNFTASHDGIGVRPLEGILDASGIDRLAALVKTQGGRVSCRKNPDGSESPYELNITYVDAVIAGEKRFPAQKFLASQAIQYVLPGVPATYVHSLLGSRNWYAGVDATGRARTINREKLNIDAVHSRLNEKGSLGAGIFEGYVHLIRTRRRQAAFHPKAGFEVLDAGPGVFAAKRFCREQEIVALTNITRKPLSIARGSIDVQGACVDLLTGQKVGGGDFRLRPYEYVWLLKE